MKRTQPPPPKEQQTSTISSSPSTRRVGAPTVKAVSEDKHKTARTIRPCTAGMGGGIASHPRRACRQCAPSSTLCASTSAARGRSASVPVLLPGTLHTCSCASTLSRRAKRSMRARSSSGHKHARHQELEGKWSAEHAQVRVYDFCSVLPLATTLTACVRVFHQHIIKSAQAIVDAETASSFHRGALSDKVKAVLPNTSKNSPTSCPSCRSSR